MSKKFTVQLAADQFDRLARPTQLATAVAELIWNGLDAESERVEVVIERSIADAVEAVTVRDWGHGMTSQEVDRDFVKLGDSWKRVPPMISKNGLRPMHGRTGEGRFRAFAIGRSVEWDTVAVAVTGDTQQLVIRGRIDAHEFEVSDPATVPGRETGTTVRITDPREFANRLTADSIFVELLVNFTLFLLRYSSAVVEYDGRKLDPSTLIANETEVMLDKLETDPKHGTPVVRILEWNEQGSKIKPSMLLCTADGNVLHQMADHMPTVKDFPYTAYVLWQGFQEHSKVLALADLGHKVLAPVLDAARDAIKRRVDEVAAQRRKRIIDEWKADDVYPLKKTSSTTAEQRKQDLFDLVAVTAAPAVSKNKTQAKLTLRLLSEAVDESPTALHRVLREVVELTPEQIEDFDTLLQQTTLGDIIRTTRLVTDRLDFLVELERMLFDRENRRRLLERAELHKILETRSWIFGEEYGVVASDKGLTRVLEEHRRLLGVEASQTTPVRGDDGNPLIIDLFLSAVAAGLQTKRHLVIELKRPSVTLGLKEIGQIEDYALTIMGEAQFQTDGLWWDFWLIGDDMNDKAKAKASQKHLPRGVIMEGENYRVNVRMWAEVLEENRRRLHFYKDYLNHKSPTDDALEATLSKYLNTPLAVAKP